MAKRAGLAILVCAVMVLVAAVPLVAGSTLIIKGEKGPNASAVTWEYAPLEYGIWNGHIANNGLRWLVVDVVDVTMGAPQEVLHQRIRFAAYDAFPTGTVDTYDALMAPGHTYAITGTPNGPRGTSCIVDDVFTPAKLPVALFDTPTVVDMTVSVDGSASYDPDAITPPGIVSYSWDWDDMTTPGSGATATHTYAMAGTYTITLTVTDADGLTDAMSQDVIISGPEPVPPVAQFTVTVNKRDVSVDGTTSYDPDGGAITAWSWDWGDASALGSGSKATHLYASEATFQIKLIVTDDESQTSSPLTKPATTWDDNPVAVFTWTVNGLVVDVNAGGVGGSTDDYGIVSYKWTWGDGTENTYAVATAQHTYPATPPGTAASTQMSTGRQPAQPFLVMGQTLDESGNVVPECSVTVTNLRTGAVNTTTSNAEYGYYEQNLNWMVGGWQDGDWIKVTAVKGEMTGEAQGQPYLANFYLMVNVVLTAAGPLPYDVTITLTVADALGQTASVTHVVTVTPP